MNKNICLRVCAILLASVFASSAVAAPPAEGSRVGLGQETAKEPAKLKNLRLDDPLVQRKYLAEPDMLRFLRGTYSEACARGMVNEAAKTMKANLKREYTPETQAAAAKILDNRRIWKMTSFEMEALFGGGYLNAANYCDCIMKEVPDRDLVDPKKGIEVVEKVSTSSQKSCERLAAEQTTEQLKKHKQ